MIFWGEPGCGKTTLARLLASRQDLTLKELSAVESGVQDLRNVIDFARMSRDTYGKKTIAFIDEIHRFSKSQQDALLRAVEDGTIILIGATTENPSFEVIPPLLSRARIVKFETLTSEDLQTIFDRAVSEDELVVKSNSVFEVSARETLIRNSGGDARILLNALELAIELTPLTDGKRTITEAVVRQALQSKTVYHDKKGDYHYDLASAFIKSMRASDPDAAIYYMARMLIGGEDPQFLARRMVILASEDIGNANPTALLLATACFQAVTVVGMPEARITLAQTCAYLASSPKSNASYVAITEAMRTTEENPDIPVPLKLRNPVTASMKAWEYGADYKYPHSYPGHFIEDPCLPEELIDKIFYHPTEMGSEKAIKERLEAWWKKRRD
jgi:putative ATPase